MNTSNRTQVGNERHGLFAWAGSRRVVLPLKGVECEFAVRGCVAEVCVSQIFRQENPKPLDCEYLFPLPADASVFFCEADINGRIIRAEIKELGEARKIVADKKAEGFRTALVESVRDNLFTLGLGNVQPDDLIVVRLKYFQTLRAVDEMRSLEIPFCPGIRYIPGKPLLRSNAGKGVVDDTDEVPDASRISPVRIDAGHPDAAYIDVRGRLDAKYADRKSVVSPSHPVEFKASAEELWVTLAEKGEVPDRDFVLRWNEANAEVVAPRAWTRENEKEAYALLEVRAPKGTASQQTALDFYFLVDRSGSMQGAKWSKAVEALQSCVAVLGPEDRVMITLFESQFQDFAERPLPVRELAKDRQFQTLERLGTGGGTEMAPALKHVLQIAGKQSQGRDRNLILITDAQIGNDAAILELMKSAPEMAVHCFGIDIALNDALLLALSRQQGGTFHSLNPNDDIQGMVTKLGKTLRQPVLLDLKLSPGWESAEAKIPNLYAGQFLYLSARTSGQTPLSLTARSPSGDPVSFNFQRQSLAEETPRLHWCKARIQRLLAEGRDREAIALSVSSNLLCRLTAFVAWDDFEKVVVARHELVQPNQELKATQCVVAGTMAAPPAPAGRPSERHFSSIRLSELSELSESEGTAHFMEPRAKKAPGLFKRLLARFPGEPGQAPPGAEAKRVPVDIHASRQAVESLRAAVLKFGVAGEQPFLQMIADWFAKAAGAELAEKTEALNRLVQKLNLCAGLLKALRNAATSGPSDQAVGLRVWQEELRKLEQQWTGAAKELKDVKGLFRQAELLEASASVQQLSLLGDEVHRRAVGMLKAFAESLPRRK